MSNDWEQLLFELSEQNIVIRQNSNTDDIYVGFSASTNVDRTLSGVASVTSVNKK